MPRISTKGQASPSHHGKFTQNPWVSSRKCLTTRHHTFLSYQFLQKSPRTLPTSQPWPQVRLLSRNPMSNKPIILPFIHSSLRKLHTIPVDLAQIVCPEKFDVKSFNATIGYFFLCTIVLIQKVARLICESDNLSKPATKCVKRQANAWPQNPLALPLCLSLPANSPTRLIPIPYKKNSHIYQPGHKFVFDPRLQCWPHWHKTHR